ncbi:homogentisate 1,2-dioxygenase [Nocardia sp. NPDC005745]|uniref:homogentisate 1,2-dioxygenase n=1 Tax=Nocardia sp. NPDC005745 TaxID=3157061 RepID=UPI00340FD4E8
MRKRRAAMAHIGPANVASHGRFEQIDNGNLATPPFDLPPAPHNYRWGPFKSSTDTDDFLDSLATLCGNGSPNAQSGMAVHVYSAARSMRDRVRRCRRQRASTGFARVRRCSATTATSP